MPAPDPQPTLFDRFSSGQPDPAVPSATESRPVFDREASARGKEAGIALAVENRKELVDKARAIAVDLLKTRDAISMDDLAEEMPKQGLDPAELGNSAGGIFKHKTFEWTGRYIKSARVASHANRLMTWRLR